MFVSKLSADLIIMVITLSVSSAFGHVKSIMAGLIEDLSTPLICLV